MKLRGVCGQICDSERKGGIKYRSDVTSLSGLNFQGNFLSLMLPCVK